MLKHLPAHQDIVYFVEVSNTLNLSRAAERLGLTQPSLSASLKRLEYSVGTELLLRDKSGVRLTPAGNTFLKHSRALIEQWNHLRSQTLRSEQKPIGRYRFASHISVALYSWTQITNTILETFPDIEIDFIHDLSRKVTHLVIECEVDFAIAINPTPHPELVMKKLASDQVRLYVTEKKNLNKDIIIFDPDMLQAQSILKKISSNHFVRKIHSSNLEVIADLTENGAGVGILPGRVATQSIHKKLKLLSGNWPYFQDEIYFIYRKDQQKSAAGQLLAHSIYSLLSSHF